MSDETEDLIRRLRDVTDWAARVEDAADLIESQAKRIEELEEELAAMLLAGGQYIAAHTLMRVRFQDADAAEIYTRAAKRFEELIDAE